MLILEGTELPTPNPFIPLSLAVNLIWCLFLVVW